MREIVLLQLSRACRAPRSNFSDAFAISVDWNLMETPLRQIRLTDFPCAFSISRASHAPHRQEQGSRVCFSAPRCVSSRTRAESRKRVERERRRVFDPTDRATLRTKINSRTRSLNRGIDQNAARADPGHARFPRERARDGKGLPLSVCGARAERARASAKRCRAPRATAVDFASSDTPAFFSRVAIFSNCVSSG